MHNMTTAGPSRALHQLREQVCDGCRRRRRHQRRQDRYGRAHQAATEPRERIGTRSVATSSQPNGKYKANESHSHPNGFYWGQQC